MTAVEGQYTRMQLLLLASLFAVSAGVGRRSGSGRVGAGMAGERVERAAAPAPWVGEQSASLPRLMTPAPRLPPPSPPLQVTAPIGMALGVALHSALPKNDPTYLMVLGIVNAIAAGMLLYVALIHMNALSNKADWLHRQPGHVQALCIGAFFLGGAAMMAVGVYA